MSRPSPGPTLALLLVLSAAPMARGEGAVEATFFDDLARRAYARRAYAEALDAFLLVNDVASSAGSLYNVAVSAELAGKSDVAFAYYREYLGRNDADVARRADAERRLALLRLSLALVDVTSDPPGAAIYVDRRELGSYGTTPRTLALGEGSHEIFLQLAGHEPTQTEVSATLGQEASISLALAPRLGDLTVLTEPKGAEVELLRGGALVKARAEAGHYRLPVGTYVVRLHPPGHVTAEARVLVHEDTPTSVSLAAAPLPLPTGKLLVSSGGVPASILVDGEPAAVTPAVLTKLTAGEHHVELMARGFTKVVRTVLVRAGQAALLEVTLTRAAAKR